MRSISRQSPRKARRNNFQKDYGRGICETDCEERWHDVPRRAAATSQGGLRRHPRGVPRRRRGGVCSVQQQEHNASERGCEC